jgi:hypothetical protein
MSGWFKDSACKPPAGSSRATCLLGAYRCFATATARGWSVGCGNKSGAAIFRVRD